MWQFLSVIKVKGNKGQDNYYYLTDKDVNGPRGLVLKQKYLVESTLLGHTVIRDYFSLPEYKGTNEVFTDFSSPENFPPSVAQAIKGGNFSSFPFPAGLIQKPLDADYQAKRESLDADYQAKQKTLKEEYLGKWESLDGYLAEWKALGAELLAKRKVLDAEYWALFAVPVNRARAWR